jgi:hypothetical protein
MKNSIKLLLSLPLVLMYASIAFAQDAKDTIKVDFLNLKAIPEFTRVIYGQKYVMKVENVNRSLYKADGSASQQDYNTEMPSIFKGFKLPGYLNLGLPSTPVDTLLKAAEVNANLRTETVRADYKQLIRENLEIINKSNKKIIETVELDNELKNLFSTCDRYYKDIEKDLLTTVDGFTGTKSTTRKDQAKGIHATLKTSIQGAVEAKEALDEAVPLHLYAINKTFKMNDTIIKVWKAAPLSKTDPRYKKEFAKYQFAEYNNDALASYKDSLKAVIEIADAEVKEMKKFRDANKIHELVNNYNMINESNFTFMTEAIEVKSDEVNFEIKINSDKQLPCNAPTKVLISETYKTKGGWKIDFSSGVFFNGGNDDFLGRELKYKTINDSTVQIQSADGGKRLLLSLGALMHIYYRTGGKVNIALSPGLSTSTAFDALNFHLGGSAIFGRKNRIVLTGGITMREAKILDKNYQYNTNYARKDVPESPATIKVFPQVGWFVSLTYNFSKFKSQ